MQGVRLRAAETQRLRFSLVATKVQHVVWYEDLNAASKPLVGGKFESLAEMALADFAVPVAFAITTTAYDRFMDDNDLHQRARDVLDIDVSNLAAISQASREMMTAITAAPIPDVVETDIRNAYQRLADEAGESDPPVAVRSSGVAEDLAGASFAGQYETYLWVVGIDAVLENVRKCWAGLFGEAVLTYHPESLGTDRSQEAMGMGVVVQRMINARSAGVTFTLDPVNGDRSKIVIEGAWGLGEAVVSGEVTPDRFRVDKVTFEVIERAISDKHVQFAFDPENGPSLIPVPDDLRKETSLTDDDVIALANLAKSIERHRGAPQDMEWAIDQQGQIALLQVRPETVWSQRATTSTATPTSAMDLIFGQFMGATGTKETGSGT